jgi:hypothetical protein
VRTWRYVLEGTHYWFATALFYIIFLVLSLFKQIMDREGNLLEKYDDIENQRRTSLTPSMFAQDDTKTLGLEKW